MSNISEFPEERRFRREMSGSGGGPEDPMLAERVEKLEARMGRVEDILREIQVTLIKIEGRMTGVEGRLAGLSDRVAGLPTVWTMLTIVFATWGIGSTILLFALNLFLKK